MRNSPGQLGVCIASSGPGASHLMTGLYGALLDHQPMLAIVGQQARNALGGQYQQELDLVPMFKDVASGYVAQASSPPQVRHLIDRAIRIGLAKRTVTAIVLPNDLQEEPYQEPPRTHGTLCSGVGYTAPKIVPQDADLDRAASVLNAGKKVAMLVGAGALGATDEIIAVTDRLSAGCAKALLGKAALPDDLPWVTGSIGLLGTEPSYRLMMECDTLLMVGSAFPYSEFLPEEGKARGLRDCRQICRTRSPGDRTGWGRGHADEQHGRAYHCCEILARLERPSLDCLRVQRPEPGDMGAADHQRRSEIRSLAADSECFSCR
jgi:pyruvate dehydrogenase (quinone)